MESFSGLLNNAALMLILCIIYDTFGIYAISKKNLRDCLTGVLVGLIGIAVMLSPWSLQPGVFFDTRWVLLSLCGLFFGLIPTAVAVIIAGAFRLYQGGPGGTVGTVVIVVTAAVGLAWRYWKNKQDKPLGWRQLYVFGVLVQLAMLSCMFLMPADMRIPIIKAVAPPILLIYPVLTMIIGLILKRQEDRRRVDKELIENREALIDRERQLQTLLQTVPVGVVVHDSNTKVIKCNKASQELLGLTEGQMLGKDAIDPSWMFCSEDESDMPLVNYPVNQVIKTKNILKNFIVGIRSNKRDVVWVLVNAVPDFDSDGNISQVIITFMDITDRKRAEEKIKQQQYLLEKAQDLSRIGSWDLDLKRNILRWTDENCRIFGVPFGSVVNYEMFLEKVHPDDRKYVIREWKASFAGKPYDIEHRLLIDGVITWVREKAEVEFDEEGVAISAIGCTQDITEQKLVQEELLESEGKYRALFEEEVHAIFVYDPETMLILDVNPAMSSTYGYSYEELIGMNCLDLSSEVEESIKAAASTDKAGKFKVDLRWHKKKDGVVFPLELVAYSTVLNGKTVKFVVINDITERKLAEAEREKLEDKLNQTQKMEAVGTMAGGIAHDFNNLLAVIQGNIDIAEEDIANGSPQAKALNAAMIAVQRATLLTKKFITFSSGGSPVKKTINPHKFIKDTVYIALSGSNIQCDFSIDRDLGMVKIDQDQMSQALGNIVTNAKEALPQGGTIHLTARNMSGEQIAHETGLKFEGDFFIKIAVEDKGEGILQKNLAKIFDPYFSSKERGTQKGMGLGLTITNSIIKKHAGHIQVESEENKGTTISIYLPVSQQNEAVVCQSTDKVVDSPPKARERKTTKILIMDDEEMLSDMTKRMLGALGYEQVEVAPHGEDALKMYTQARDRAEPFDLLLLDLTIKGGMGGEETIQRLYEMNSEVRAIVCSGYTKEPVVANYAAYGFIGVLAKPFSREELNNTITQAIDKK